MMAKRIVYREIAQRLQAMANCVRSDNDVWYGKHRDAIEKIISEFMPSGSGIDSGTSLISNGYYDGWTQHTVIVRPSLSSGIEVTITGRNRNEIKDYLADIYKTALLAEFDSELLLESVA